jgi:hypothetical protein
VHEIMILAANSHHAMVVPGWIYKFILQVRSLAVVGRARSVLLGLGSPPLSSTDLRALLHHACAFPNPCYRTPSGTQRPVAGSSCPSQVLEASLGAAFILPPTLHEHSRLWSLARPGPAASRVSPAARRDVSINESPVKGEMTGHVVQPSRMRHDVPRSPAAWRSPMPVRSLS